MCFSNWFYNWFYAGAAGSTPCRQKAQILVGMPPDSLFATQNGILQMRFPLELKLRGDTVEPGLPKMLDATLHGAWLKPAGADCATLLPVLGSDWAAPLSIEHGMTLSRRMGIPVAAAIPR